MCLALNRNELKRRIVECAKIRRWYQTPDYNGLRPRGHFDDGKTNTISYGMGKWNNYIQPLLDKVRVGKDFIFCDIGCSAGEYLVAAKNYGFKRVIGVEAARGGFAQLLLTKNLLCNDIEAYNNSLGKPEVNIAEGAGEPLDLYTFPMADVTLMSNVHYHFTEANLNKYLNLLADKTLYLIIITDEKAQGVIDTSSQFVLSKATNGGWDLVDMILTGTPDYPDMRHLTAILLKSKRLYKLRVDECLKKQIDYCDYNKTFYTKVFPEFIECVLSGDINKDNCQFTIVFDWSVSPNHGSTPWAPQVAMERTLSYINQIKTIKEHGQEMPILDKQYFESDLWDGNHRIAVLKHFNIPWVFAEKWEEHKRFTKEWGYL